MAFFRFVGVQLWERVIKSYKSTLIGIALAAAIVFVDSSTDYLKALPQGWAQALAGLSAIVGALLRARQASPPALKPVE